uniref:Sulfate_transp domain-containing protein n=1 Tax=Heligmosomoides polygyrus TaxID=6339 RepID=A0A8L8JU84_HELPZ
LERVIRPFTSISLFWKTFVSFVPILQWLPRYTIKQDLTGDITGGLMVGIVHVPQGIAYAVLAGVDPAVGLYTSFFPVLAYMLFGTSRHNSLGSFAVVAIMTGNIVSKYAVPSGTINVTAVNVSFSSEHVIEPIEVATVLSLTAGLTQIIVAVVGLDFLTTYFSEQLVAGFTTGAGMHALVTQFKDVTGIYDTPRRSGFATVVRRVVDIAAEIYRTNLAALLTTAIATALLLFGNLCINPFVVKHSPVPIPFELLLVIVGAVASWLLDLETKFDVKTVGVIETGIPLPKFPRWELLSSVALDAIPVAIVVMAVHVSMAKLLAKKHNYTIDLKQVRKYLPKHLFKKCQCFNSSDFFSLLLLGKHQWMNRLPVGAIANGHAESVKNFVLSSICVIFRLQELGWKAIES